MSSIWDDFDWSFLGAVIVISLACFALIISVVYYCWLYEVIPSFKVFVLSLCGIETKKSRKRKERLMLPVTARNPQYPNINRINSENVECHVIQRVPQRPKHNKILRRSNSHQNGNHRPTTASRQTRQRAVNIAIHELKSQSHDQRESPPTKPVKSEAVKAYVKSTGASTSSVVESYSSTTITDDMISSESESESKQVVREERIEAAGAGYNAASHNFDDEATGERNLNKDQTQKKATPDSHRTKKWSEINRKLEERDNRFTHVAEQLMHKPGRSTRAVAPCTLQQSGEQVHDTTLHMGEVVDHIGSKRRFDTERLSSGSIFEVLQSLRKAGNLGINPVDNPVSRLFTSDSERHRNVVMGSVETFKQSIERDQPQEKVEDSSASDEIKSSSDSSSESDSSLVVLSRSPNFKQPSNPSQANNLSLQVELSGDVTPSLKGHEMDRAPVQVEINNIPIDHPEVGPCSSADLETDGTSHKIDPSKQVFGREDTATPDLDKRESLVRRIDSLFCSTTPSSLGSCVSDNVFEEQMDHNINNLNNLGYSDKQSPDLKIQSGNRSSDDEIVMACEKISENIFITEPNIYDSNEVPKTSMDTNISNQLKSATGKVDGSLDSSSSFNSTTLPSVTSDNNTSSTLELTSEEDNEPGKLKFFQ